MSLIYFTDAGYEVDRIIQEKRTDYGTEYLVEWKGYEETTWEPESNLCCPVLLKEYKIRRLRQEIQQCVLAPSRIPDSWLCFEVLTGNVDWRVPLSLMQVKPIPKRECRAGFSSSVSSMSRVLRESRCEQGLYPRVACILVEAVELYRDLIPEGIEIFVQPSMPFQGTDKSTDYAVVVVTACAASPAKVERPIMIFEIKRSVNADLSRINIGDLVQTLLESCYCGICSGCQKIVACLTDVTTWHFMKCSCQPAKQTVSVQETMTLSAIGNQYDGLTHAIAGMFLKEVDEFEL